MAVACGLALAGCGAGGTNAKTPESPLAKSTRVHCCPLTTLSVGEMTHGEDVVT